MSDRASIFQKSALDVSGFSPRTGSYQPPYVMTAFCLCHHWDFQRSKSSKTGHYIGRLVSDERPAPEQLDELTRGSKFRSRETIDQPREMAEPHRAPEQRRRRTGRNVQFNIRATQAVIDEFKSISERQDWPDGLTLERALEALKRELAG